MSTMAERISVTQLAAQEIESQYAKSSVKGKAAARLEIVRGMELLIEHNTLVRRET